MPAEIIRSSDVIQNLNPAKDKNDKIDKVAHAVNSLIKANRSMLKQLKMQEILNDLNQKLIGSLFNIVIVKLGVTKEEFAEYYKASNGEDIDNELLNALFEN